MKLLFNPLSWPQKAATLALAVVLLWGGLWWFNSKIRDHYQAPLLVKYKAAADAAESLRLERESSNNAKMKGAKDAKVQKLEKNLVAAKRAADSALRLRDAIRASEDSAKASLTTCVQHASTLGELLNSSADLARRIAKEADGHVADKQELTAAWPQ